MELNESLENSLSTLAVGNDYEGISLKNCQVYIDQPTGTPDDLSSEGLNLIFDSSISPNILGTIYANLKLATQSSNSITSGSTATLLKRLIAALLFLVRTSSDYNVCFGASKILLLLCSIPGASACGILTSNLITSLSSTLNKAVIYELQCKPAVQSSGTTKKTSKKGRTARGKFGRDSDSEVDEDVSDDHVPSTQDLFSQVDLNQESDSLAFVRMVPESLKGFLLDLLSCISLYTERNDEHVIDNIVEGLSGALYLAIQREPFAALAGLCTDILISIQSYSDMCIMSVFRSLQSGITMTGHDRRLPESFKIRTACHRAAIKVVSRIADSISVSFKTSSQPADATLNTDSTNDHVPATVDAMSTDTDPSAVDVDKDVISFSVNIRCVLGCLQRLTICPSIDKAPYRTVLLQSIVDILDRIVAMDSVCQSSIATDAKALKLKIVHHYLNFIFKLSKSSKIGHRAFSVEVANAILNTTWIWLPEYKSSAEGSDKSGDEDPCPLVLLYTLVKRCNDVAPTVRLRAISVIHDLLSILATAVNSTVGIPRLLAVYMLQLAFGFRFNVTFRHKRVSIGGNSHDTSVLNSSSTSEYVNLLEILRSRTSDEKPLVRAKAIQSYGQALALSWPKFVNENDTSDSVDIEFVNMLITEDDVNVFVDGCGDMTSVLTRKQSLISLTSLVEARPHDVLLQEAWVMAVLPLVADAEASIQMKLSQFAYELVVANLLKWANASENIAVAGSSITWQICDKIARSGKVKLLRTCVGYMFKYGSLRTNKVSGSGCCIDIVISAIKKACCIGLQGHTSFQAQSMNTLRDEDPELISKAGWVLLECVLGHDNVVASTVESVASKDDADSADFVVECFFAKTPPSNRQRILDEDDVRMLVVLEKLAPKVSLRDAQAMSQELTGFINALDQSPDAIAATIAVKVALSKRLTAGQDLSTFHANIFEWSSKLIALAVDALGAIVWCSEPSNSLSASLRRIIEAQAERNRNFSEAFSEPSIRVFNNALFLLGELAMIGFAIEEDENHFSSYISHPPVVDYHTSQINPKAFRLVVSSEVLALVQILLGECLPALPQDVSQQSVERVCPVSVRAHAFVTMGKLCLRSQRLARDHVNVFLRELHNDSALPQPDGSIATGSSNGVIRSNALLVLGDLCIRYTNLVDRHVGAMASCLQDRDVTVRRNAFVLLTQLLLQDYLKWRGMLLFRFLATAVDIDPEFMEFSRIVLRKTMQTKYPEFFSQHFAEAVIVFNECQDHPIYAAAAATGSDGGSLAVTMDGVHLQGRNKRAQRLKLYDFMMEDLTEEQRIQVTAKLVQDILSNALDASLLKSRKDNGMSSLEEVLEDALLILRSPLLKVGRKGSSPGGAGGDDDLLDDDLPNPTSLSQPEPSGMDSAAAVAAVNRAKTKVLRTLSKQHLVNHVLPVVTSLKHVLEAARSPVQGSLMEYLLYLWQTHKAEVEETLNADPTLKAEIEYDLKMFERLKTQRQQATLDIVEMVAATALTGRKSLDEPPSRRLSIKALGNILTSPAGKYSEVVAPNSGPAAAANSGNRSAAGSGTKFTSPVLRKSLSGAKLPSSRASMTRPSLSSATRSPAAALRRWSVSVDHLGPSDPADVLPLPAMPLSEGAVNYDDDAENGDANLVAMPPPTVGAETKAPVQVTASKIIASLVDDGDDDGDIFSPFIKRGKVSIEGGAVSSRGSRSDRRKNAQAADSLALLGGVALNAAGKRVNNI